jgi:Domain of unknown function (DUF4265)
MTVRHQIRFALKQDALGFPPARSETVWAAATEVPMEYVLDNIPFFARAATLGDRVRVEAVDGALWYRDTLIAGSSSLLRVAVRKDPQPVREELEKLGCACELSIAYHLIAANVPREKLAQVKARLIELVKAGEVDYEEALLR